MKKIMLAVCLMVGGAMVVNAQQTPASPPAQTQSVQDQDQGQQIAISELPDAVKAKLESQDYSGWTIGNAYKKTDESQVNAETYSVEMKKGTEIRKVKFDKDGNEMKADANELNDNQGQPHDQGQVPDKQDEKQ